MAFPNYDLSFGSLGIQNTLYQGMGMVNGFQAQGQMLFNQEMPLVMSMLGGVGGGILGGSLVGGFGGFGGNPLMTLLPMLGILGLMMMLLSQMQQNQSNPYGSPYGGYPGSSPYPSFPAYPQQPPCEPPLPPPGCPGLYPPNYGEGGNVTQEKPGGPITYTDPNGWKVVVNPGQYPTVTITSPDGKHTITESGDPHESGAQGAESTWTSKDRVIELPDGTVINMNAFAKNGAINNVNIFSGGQEINVNAQNGTYDVNFNPYQTWQDESQLPTDNIASVGYQNGQFSLIPMQQEFDPYTQVPANQTPDQNQAQAENKAAPLWAWALCPPAALMYDMVNHAGVGGKIDDAVSSAGNWINQNILSPIGHFLTQPI
jgi:hypothetical protein